MPPPVPEPSAPEPAPPLAPEPPGPRPRADVNFLLIAGSVAVALLTSLGESEPRLLPLFISNWPAASPGALGEVRHGEIWRLFTPAFVHFGVAHLALNMMAMVNLGAPIEQVQGPRFYLGFAALVAVCGNVAQYLVSGDYHFGGMSGVIFGLFGFLWLRAWCDREYALRLRRGAVISTLLWFAFCFTGVLPIANTAHAAGLGVGMAWGALSGLAARRARERRGLTATVFSS